MAMKTNKSYLKRLKVTKSGRILGRKPGQNHFNAKEGTTHKAAKGRRVTVNIKNKERSRYLVNF
jgi:ribosomal protein L35